ncbi:MAG: methionyl-tRNA formyltransferase [Chloroflexia bacterium]
MADRARVVFMGTSRFAIPALRALVEEGYEVREVVTQPDRLAGRTRHPTPPPVKQVARELGLPVWQPDSLRGQEAFDHLAALQPEVIVVAAYGEILRRAILALPPKGCLNLHASLLPRHRGPAPVPATILAGDTVTGVTLIQMDEGVDTGPIVAQREIPLTGQERQDELLERLAQLAASLLCETLPAWLAGRIVPRPQDEALATYCCMLRKVDGEIDWHRPAWYIERMTRAFHPWPGAYTFLGGRMLRILRASVLAETRNAPPGTVLVEGDLLVVTTGEGMLRLDELQLEGKRALPASEFLRGQRGIHGKRLGRTP